MERLTNKREADAQREEYERRLANGYPRNIPEERFLRLAAYEDTGLEPEEINDLASVREISPEAEYAINKHADNIIERLDKLLHQTDDDARLRELAEADKDGRLVVLPCKVGDTVYLIVTKRARNYTPEFRFVKKSRLTFLNMERILQDFGKEAFLTREEAEKALEGMTC
nr:MAG TPA: hypothetical protein [Caudoviricetes sp.]